MNGTMTAAVLEKDRRVFDLRQVPIPTPEAGELLVRLEACGVCHTDIHIRDYVNPPPSVRYPLIPGHEGVGRVVAAGAGASRIAVGQRVGVPWIHDACLGCSACLGGHVTSCGKQRAHGFSVPGAFAEYVIVKEAFAPVLPEETDPVLLAPLMCAGATAEAALDRAGTKAGEVVLVLGCGGLGQLAIQLARSRGATVIAADVDPVKLQIAKECGASHVVTADETLGKEVQGLGGADVLLYFAPTHRVWDQVAASMKPAGRVIVIALIFEPVSLSLRWVMNSGCTITGLKGASVEEAERVAQLAREGKVRIDVERVPLARINEAVNDLEHGRIRGRIVIDFQLG